ncbi:RNA polymerase I-specific transcription initiation factor RRN3 [Octopus bimaculoides]|uniref:RNA polymerase I-specific transcription initiation factor RRN3 n=1 Tax=Octopus bimaculoides TaxID=37653 RepID=A0A0L8I7F3_OCTBM|nr:RNA polymerase I-specific transcription initiation factor RRN3 [Octopus bimaculoides]XP_014788780.1 RNA polymerase I-specific transcription initiation factor RRN3 [Octopus bimaculoides]|eukprot:XP_014788773.1 PREDICTED: RNA polymerase I-specific transcription initiation factor RRN3-like [Octopus bimaculoides]
MMSKKTVKKKPYIQKKFDVAVALKEHKKGKNDLYLDLMTQLKKYQDVKLLKAYLTDFQDCVSLLDGRYYDFVRDVSIVNWFVNEALSKHYLSFLKRLVVAQPVHLKFILQKLLQHFKPVLNSSVPVDIQQKEHLILCGHIQLALKSIFGNMPMMPNVLMSLLSKEFPYFKGNVFTVECYTRNLLQISMFMPDHRYKILELIITKMVNFDLLSPHHEIFAENESDDLTEMIDVVAKTEFDLNTNQLMKHPQAEMLDVLMNILLSHIQNVAYNNFENTSLPDGNMQTKIDLPSCKKLYRELLLIFENVILPTHKTYHVQFFMFYICKYHILLCDGFLDYLWKKFSNPNTEPIFRVTCSSYLGSFLARSKYVPVSSLLVCLEVFCQWIHDYIDMASNNKDKKPAFLKNHEPFYYLCQAVFYVFVFRVRDILDSEKAIRRALSWNFQRIITCYLNPLKFCMPQLVNKFASITELYQLAMCDTIIEKNRREILKEESFQIAYVDRDCILNSFFPFDPYLLSRSSPFIQPIYREYDTTVPNNQATYLKNRIDDDDDDFLPQDVNDAEDKTILSIDEFSLFNDCDKEIISGGSKAYDIPRRNWKSKGEKNEIVEAMMASL